MTNREKAEDVVVAGVEGDLVEEWRGPFEGRRGDVGTRRRRKRDDAFDPAEMDRFEAFQRGERLEEGVTDPEGGRVGAAARDCVLVGDDERKRLESREEGKSCCQGAFEGLCFLGGEGACPSEEGDGEVSNRGGGDDGGWNRGRERDALILLDTQAPRDGPRDPRRRALGQRLDLGRVADGLEALPHVCAAFALSEVQPAVDLDAGGVPDGWMGAGVRNEVERGDGPGARVLCEVRHKEPADAEDHVGRETARLVPLHRAPALREIAIASWLPPLDGERDFHLRRTAHRAPHRPSAVSAGRRRTRSVTHPVPSPLTPTDDDFWGGNIAGMQRFPSAEITAERLKGLAQALSAKDTVVFHCQLSRSYRLAPSSLTDNRGAGSLGGTAVRPRRAGRTKSARTPRRLRAIRARSPPAHR